MKSVKKTSQRRSPRHSRYLYLRIEWLYVHSFRARVRFLYLVLAFRAVQTFKQRLISVGQGVQAIYRHHLTVRFAAFAAMLAISSILLQLAYPAQRSLPFSRLENNGFVGFKSEAEIAAKLDGIDSQKITILAKDTSVDISPREMGIALDTPSTFKRLSSYSKTQRLVPFSILAVGAKNHNMVRHIDDKKLDDFIARLDVATYKAPRDAGVSLKDTKLNIAPAEDGYQYHSAEIKKQLASLNFNDRNPLLLMPEILLPRISTDIASQKAELMQRRIDTPLVIWADDKSLVADAAMIASWIDITAPPDQNSIELTFNKARVAESLRPFAGILETAAKPAVSTFLNGSLAGSVDGSTGRKLLFDELVDQVVRSTDPSTKNIAAQVEPILAKQKTVQSYSRDNRGMQSLLDRWTAEHGGQYSVSMRTLNGTIQAEINPYQSYPSQGLNRLYVAHLIYGRLAANSLSMTSPTNAGMNVDSCLEQMLVNGNENCYYALGDIVGWEANSSMLASQGFEGTALPRGSGSTTASDSAEWLIKVQGSSIVTSAQTNELINRMSRHSQRSGIPAGSPGILVAETTSTSGGNRQEAGLVFHPRGAYVLSIMSSKNGKASDIAELAAEINRVLNE